MSEANYLNTDGSLRILQWAQAFGQYADTLRTPLNPLPNAMAHSNATGRGLLTNGSLGIDMINLSAGDGFQPHTHPGDHLLIIIAGLGTITYNGIIYPTKAGQLYMVEGEVPHAVGAITDHTILAVGSPHKPVDSPDRMVPVAYQAVEAEFGELCCLICNKKAASPIRLCDRGCPHCPCIECNPVRLDSIVAGHHNGKVPA